MRWPRVRLTIGQGMVLVVDIALLLAAASNSGWWPGIDPVLAMIFVAASFGGAAACGSWASRRFWTAILFPLGVWSVAPWFGPALGYYLANLLVFGGLVGWTVGVGITIFSAQRGGPSGR